jgi:hypothetical protein
MMQWSIIIIGAILDLGDGLRTSKKEKTYTEENVHKVIAEKMSLDMIAKAVKTETDGIMMKPAITGRTEGRKGTMKQENVEDPNTTITGRGRRQAEKESQRSPDIGQGQETLTDG